MTNKSKYVIVDRRIRTIEKEYIESMGYTLILLNENKNIYYEISSHTDILCCKIEDIIVFEPNTYEYIAKIQDFRDNICDKYNCIKGSRYIQSKYPFDISYNLCTIGEYAIHNFKYTDKLLRKIVVQKGYNTIDVEQGYTKCSIAVVDDSSCITSDKPICDILTKKGIDVLYIPSEKMNIKLLKSDKEYSKMFGFIGGATARIDNEFLVFGDIKNIDEEYRIKLQDFIQKKNLKLKYFSGQDIVDYGSIVIVD